MKFELTKKQYSELEALAYWIADLAYFHERSAKNEPEEKRIRETLEKCVFPALDEMGVPFWVQNTVIAFGNDWRRYKTEYLDCYLKSKNITIS